jgi:hypothetical protein
MAITFEQNHKVANLIPNHSRYNGFGWIKLLSHQKDQELPSLYLKSEKLCHLSLLSVLKALAADLKKNPISVTSLIRSWQSIKEKSFTSSK